MDETAAARAERVKQEKALLWASSARTLLAAERPSLQVRTALERVEGPLLYGSCTFKNHISSSKVMNTYTAEVGQQESEV